MSRCILAYGEEPYRIEADIRNVGENFAVIFGGGAKHHIGAVAVGEPYPSSRGDGSITASVSVIGVYGHKDDAIAREAALALAKRAGTVVATTVGIHIDRATREEIELLQANFTALLGLVGKKISEMQDEGQGTRL